MAKTEEDFNAASEAAMTAENARKDLIVQLEEDRDQAETNRQDARDDYATLIALRISTIQDNTQKLLDGEMPVIPPEFGGGNSSSNSTRRRRSTDLSESMLDDLARVKREGNETTEPEVVTPKTRPAPKPVVMDSCQAMKPIGVHPTGGGSITNAVACDCEVRASYRKNVKVTVDDVVTNKIEEPKSDEFTLLKPKIEQQVKMKIDQMFAYCICAALLLHKTKQPFLPITCN